MERVDYGSSYSLIWSMGITRLKPTRLIQRQRRDAIKQQLATAGKDGGESRSMN